MLIILHREEERREGDGMYGETVTLMLNGFSLYIYILQTLALVYDILPPTTAIIGYAIAQTAVSL